jgi:hypothetical protein
MHRDAAIPRKAGGRPCCPFDPIVWERARAERLFDFHYPSAHTPAYKRQFGYCFAFLMRDRIAGGCA